MGWAQRDVSAYAVFFFCNVHLGRSEHPRSRVRLRGAELPRERFVQTPQRVAVGRVWLDVIQRSSGRRQSNLSGPPEPVQSQFGSRIHSRSTHVYASGMSRDKERALGLVRLAFAFVPVVDGPCAAQTFRFGCRLRCARRSRIPSSLKRRGSSGAGKAFSTVVRAADNIHRCRFTKRTAPFFGGFDTGTISGLWKRPSRSQRTGPRA